VSVQVKNAQGEYLGTAVTLVTVQAPCEARVAHVSPGLTVTVTSRKVYLDAQASVGIAPLLYEVAWGDGVTTVSAVPHFTHAYHGRGPYLVTVIVHDGAGRRSRLSTTLVLVPPPGMVIRGGGGGIKDRPLVVEGAPRLAPALLTPSGLEADSFDPPALTASAGRGSLSLFTTPDGGFTWHGTLTVVGNPGDPAEVFQFYVTGTDTFGNHIEALNDGMALYVPSLRQPDGTYVPPPHPGTDTTHRTILAAVPYPDPPDTEPPVTTMAMGEPKVWEEGRWVVASTTGFTFTARDYPLVQPAGVAFTEVQVNGGVWQRLDLNRFTLPFATPEGEAVVAYRSRDLLDHMESPHTLTLRLDNARFAPTGDTPSPAREPMEWLTPPPAEAAPLSGDAVTVAGTGPPPTWVTVVKEGGPGWITLPLATRTPMGWQTSWDTTGLPAGRYLIEAGAMTREVQLDPVTPTRVEIRHGARVAVTQRPHPTQASVMPLPDGATVTLPAGPSEAAVTVVPWPVEQAPSRTLPPSDSVLQPVGSLWRVEGPAGAILTAPVLAGQFLAARDPETGRWAPLAPVATPARSAARAAVFPTVKAAALPPGPRWVGVFQTAAPTDLNQVIVYPNPFKPTTDPAHTAVTFEGLPPQVTLELYTAAGWRVRRIEAVTTGLLTWDGNNEQGEAVASGVYLYLLTSGPHRKSGKLVVIR